MVGSAVCKMDLSSVFPHCRLGLKQCGLPISRCRVDQRDEQRGCVLVVSVTRAGSFLLLACICKGE